MRSVSACIFIPAFVTIASGVPAGDASRVGSFLGSGCLIGGPSHRIVLGGLKVSVAMARVRKRQLLGTC